MNVEFPRLADTLVEGVVSAWYKKPGDTVKRGEPLFAVETDKVNTDVESPCDGVLAEILVPEGEHADVGQILARFAGEEGVHTAVSRPIAQGSCAKLVDLSAIERRGASWTAYFVKAFAQALEADRIGVAVEIQGGLVVPVVPDARDASLHDISVRIADLAARARENALKATDVGGAAASVTNVGATGTLLAFPLVAPGEPAILAPGAIVDGRCWLALCYDRAHYDEYAADRLLTTVVERLRAL